eukprot:scaffold485_cov33-Attheya_sp.AAC.2
MAKGYDFTGSLRPVLLSPKREVPATIRHPDYADEPNGTSYCEERDRANNRIYGPKELDVTWGDNWTAVTRDGSRSIQLEHSIGAHRLGD